MGHYTVQTETQDDPTTPENESKADSPWGVGGQWQGGGFLVFANYITSDSDSNAKDNDAWKVGGRYGFDKFAIFGQCEGDGGAISNRFSADVAIDGSTVELDGVGKKSDTWFLGGTATFGNNMLYAAYGQGGDKNGAIVDTISSPLFGEVVSNEYDSYEIAGVHSLSKRTKAYIGYASQDFDKGDKRTSFALGIKHTF